MVIRLISWFAENARPLPWREPNVTAWGILVSEVMLQQTPVARVEPMWHAWMRRWPTPGDLASASTAEVLEAWGRLGYPRRALRLHQAAHRIATEYDGQVPSDAALLRALPGIGEYTAAAIQSFAFGMPALVLDINIRRVLGRVFGGVERVSSSITHTDRQWAARAFDEAHRHPSWNAAIMEFGALICTSRSPACGECPIADRCKWRLAGYPPSELTPRTQAWEGTDRQARGIIIDFLRHSPSFAGNVDELRRLWPDASQLSRAIASLTHDGLIHSPESDVYYLGSAQHIE
ncbi:A/G-specific adenine glycosylase [Actinomycetaceae bacterium WB03_NA08]|uniref:Adenine DNA glycosylase n=1 Tax=Scrofimicrobium canadense TaxID=2652290 RepID=A0A6N7VPN4_9ACTO|nr:A/G-specific adenine glycosylase [Scrofimicrobium canadense]